MALLCLKVIRGVLQLPDHGENSTVYAAVKVENLKAFSTHLSGDKPHWNQEFFFEISRIDLGVEIELWEKGFMWDKLKGDLIFFRLFNRIIRHVCANPQDKSS